MFASENLDVHVISGISLGFALIFFVPLLFVAIAFFAYCAFSRRSVLRTAKVLSIIWALACVPAALLIVMGYAFNSNKMHPLLVVPLWVLVGLVALWLPVALRVVFRIRPV